MDDFLEYRVNLLVDNSDQHGAPVVIETNPTYINLFGSIESTMSRIGIEPDRLHPDQGRVVPQGQRRLPRLQRPGRPHRAGRLDDPQADPAEPDLRDPELSSRCTCSRAPRLKPEPIGRHQGRHDRRRLPLQPALLPGRGLQEDLQDEGRVRHGDGQGREDRSATTSASSRRSSTRRNCFRFDKKGIAASSSTRRASPGGRRSSRPGSTTSPTSSARPTTGPARTEGRPSDARTSIRPSRSRSTASA